MMRQRLDDANQSKNWIETKNVFPRQSGLDVASASTSSSSSSLMLVLLLLSLMLCF